MLILFPFFPLYTLFLAVVDSCFLLFTPIDEWKGLKPASRLVKHRKRIYLYSLLPFLYFGTPMIPFLSTANYGEPEGVSYFRNFSLPAAKLPVFFRDEYNIRFFGLEKMHPFDSQKYGRIFSELSSKRLINAQNTIAPPMLSDEMLLTVHPKEYLSQIENSMQLLKILEIPVVGILPWRLTHRHVLTPMRYATSGTILAAKAAFQHGWAINLGGGFHHAHAKEGGGFCVFADITLAIRNLREAAGRPLKVMIIDLDAHQGNGHERDFLGDKDPFIFDAYNPSIYPNDLEAKSAISLRMHTPVSMSDEFYLEDLKKSFKEAGDRFSPDFILYNAGTDIMSGDPLGMLDISAEGILKRDEMVFRWARDRKVPIAMVLSGGYQQSNAPAIASSIENLLKNVVKASPASR